MAKHALNTKTNSKKHSKFSKLFIGSALAVLLVFAVSNYGRQLTGLPVAIGTNLTTSREQIAIDIINLDSIQIDGSSTPMSFTAMKLTTPLSSRYKFRVAAGGSGLEINQVYILLKNTSGTDAAAYVGAAIYLNPSGAYVSSAILTGLTATKLTRDLPLRDTTTASTVGYATVELTTNLNFNTNRGVARRGTLTITDDYYLSNNPNSRSGRWIFYFTFGAGSSTGSSSATDATFRNSLSSTISGTRVNYKYSLNGHTVVSELPYCSPRGSCIKDGDLTPRSTILRYATQAQSLD